MFWFFIGLVCLWSYVVVLKLLDSSCVGHATVVAAQASLTRVSWHSVGMDLMLYQAGGLVTIYGVCWDMMYMGHASEQWNSQLARCFEVWTIDLIPLLTILLSHFCFSYFILCFIIALTFSLLQLSNHGSNLAEEELESHTISAWKEAKQHLSRQIVMHQRQSQRQLIHVPSSVITVSSIHSSLLPKE